MNNMTRNMVLDKVKMTPGAPPNKLDYPSEVEEVYLQEFNQFDTSNCRARSYMTDLVECLTPQYCHICNHSIPFANKHFCKHPLVIRRADDNLA